MQQSIIIKSEKKKMNSINGGVKDDLRMTTLPRNHLGRSIIKFQMRNILYSSVSKLFKQVAVVHVLIIDTKVTYSNRMTVYRKESRHEELI